MVNVWWINWCVYGEIYGKNYVNVMFERNNEDENLILFYEFIIEILCVMEKIMEVVILDCKNCFCNYLGKLGD